MLLCGPPVLEAAQGAPCSFKEPFASFVNENTACGEGQQYSGMGRLGAGTE